MGSATIGRSPRSAAATLATPPAASARMRESKQTSWHAFGQPEGVGKCTQRSA